MAARTVPDTVARRIRAVRFTDAAIGVVVLSVVLHFIQPGVSNLVWMLGGIAAALGTLALRRSINGLDRPDADFDEYQLAQHLQARETGLRHALLLSIGLFALAGATAFASRFWHGADATGMALFFAKAIYVQLVWVPYSVARSLARKISRDELVSADS